MFYKLIGKIKEEIIQIKENKIVETCGVALIAVKLPCKKTSQFIKRNFQGSSTIFKEEFGKVKTKGNLIMRGCWKCNLKVPNDSRKSWWSYSV